MKTQKSSCAKALAGQAKFKTCPVESNPYSTRIHPVKSNPYSTRIIFLTIILFGFFGVVKSSQAAVDLPWETTYDCADWNQYSDPLNCDGLSKGGAWTSPEGHYEQITIDANNLNGGGGKGQRNWYGDGTNHGSGGTVVSFNSPQSEFWIRLYIKFPSGFTWQNGYPYYDKLLYIDSGKSQAVVPEFYGSEIGITIMDISNNIDSTGSKGWTNIMGGATGDSLWHCYEWHLKSDTNDADGVVQTWVDGVLVLDRNDLNYYSTNTKWSSIALGNNQKYVLNGQDVPVDYDDVSIYNTTPPNTDAQGNPFIGPIGWAGSDTTPPSHPTGLSVS